MDLFHFRVVMTNIEVVIEPVASDTCFTSFIYYFFLFGDWQRSQVQFPCVFYNGNYPQVSLIMNRGFLVHWNNPPPCRLGYGKVSALSPVGDWKNYRDPFCGTNIMLTENGEKDVILRIRNVETVRGLHGNKEAVSASHIENGNDCCLILESLTLFSCLLNGSDY